uniref:Uncharacterized protein n=1 Tax=Cacopsylla melanoneura TaxID=428564 RepID=A0A8D9F3Q4_9HEMI
MLMLLLMSNCSIFMHIAHSLIRNGIQLKETPGDEQELPSCRMQAVVDEMRNDKKDAFGIRRTQKNLKNSWSFEFPRTQHTNNSNKRYQYERNVINVRIQNDKIP